MQLSLRSRTTSISNSFDEFIAVVRDAATRSSHGERGPDNRRETQCGLHLQGLFQAVGDRRPCRAETQPGHRGLELFAILRFVDGFLRRADHLDAVFFQHTVLGQIERAVKRGLPAHGRQQRIGALLLDDLLDHLPGNRLDVGDIGHVRIGHDRRRIAVDEDDLVALLAQRLAGLRTGIVEFARLPDDDGTGADDEDAVEVSALGHGRPSTG